MRIQMMVCGVIWTLLTLPFFVLAQTSVPSASGTVSCPPYAYTLWRGMRGENVRQLQQFLIAQGLLAPDNATGFFGVLTEAAVQQLRCSENVVDTSTPTSLNVGPTKQQKSGGLHIVNLLEANSLIVYGNGLLSGGNRYLNFGSTAGESGYGFRDNNGTMQFKNSGGSWTNIGGSGDTSGGNTGQITIPNCSSGQVLTATNGSLSCISVASATGGGDEGTWCGLATASDYKYLSYPYQTTPSRGNFKSIISCKGTSIVQSCPSGYSQQTICDTNGVDSGDAGSLQPFINTCFRTCIKGTAPTNPGLQFLQGLENGQTQVSPELQQWLNSL